MVVLVKKDGTCQEGRVMKKVIVGGDSLSTPEEFVMKAYPNDAIVVHSFSYANDRNVMDVLLHPCLCQTTETQSCKLCNLLMARAR